MSSFIPEMAQDERLTGVIDTISDGYRTLNRKPWLMAIPVLLDLYLWLGPHLTASPLFQRLSIFSAPPVGLPLEQAQALQQLQEAVAKSASGFNLFTLLSPGILGVPSMVGPGTLPASLANGKPWAFSVSSNLIFLGLFGLLVFAGLLLGCFYLGLIAQAVRDGGLDVSRLLRRVWLYWARLLFFMALAMTTFFVLGMPLLLLLGLASLVSPHLASLLLGIAWVATLWVAFYLYFFVDALVVSEMGVFRAIWSSVMVIHHHFASSFGFIILSILIGLGLPLAWQLLLGSPWGVPIAIVGNAYVGTGLIAASMIFYRDRYLRIQAMAARFKNLSIGK